jgi:hypothetical protein
MLDYLKPSEYEHLNAFILALKLFELNQIGLKGLRIRDGGLGVETVILDDFISWLWSQIVVDMNPIDVSSCSPTFWRRSSLLMSFSIWEIDVKLSQVLNNFFKKRNIARGSVY